MCCVAVTVEGRGEGGGGGEGKCCVCEGGDRCVSKVMNAEHSRNHRPLTPVNSYMQWWGRSEKRAPLICKCECVNEHM